MFPIILASALSLLTLDAAPATSPPETVAPVTVQAAPRTPAAVLKQSRSFVQAYAVPTAILGQFPRWHDPLCVAVVGLVPEQAAMVSARIEDVAKAVGLRIDRPKCRANVQVVFTDRPQELLDWVAKRNDTTLGFHYAFQTKALKTVTRPVQAWYMTATRGGGANNTSLAFMIVESIPPTSGPGGVGLPGLKLDVETVDTPRNGTPNGCAGLRYTSCLQGLIKNVLVVVDNGRVRDKPLGPITDYLAMLALTQPRSLDGCAAFPSVIDLFAPAACPGRDAPDGLTAADASYLTALYAADPQAKKAVQQSQMAERMASTLVKARPAVRKDHDGAAASPGGVP